MILNNVKYILLFGICLIVANLSAQMRIEQSEELGMVHWYRDYDKAIIAGEKETRDIVLLFQEVPGCSTCRNYGHNVLSHPLIVDALENLFIPLAIFNNKGGKDKEILEKYDEPAWNNPVVRMIDTKGDDIAPRISNDYSALTFCQRMKASLAHRQKEIPEYLNLLETELLARNSDNIKERHYKMYCFWTGEKQLGKVDGVLHNESGCIKSDEVVKVKYDANTISEKDLDEYAWKNDFEPIDGRGGYKKANNDVHYYLRQSKYAYLPLTELQQIKINSALGEGESAEIYLSPQQLKWSRVSNPKNPKMLLDMDFRLAWQLKDGDIK
jgi:hypothetical protein